MRVTKTEYSSMTDKASKNSSLLKDCSCAFLVGGAICTIGHSLFLMYRSFGLQEIDSRAATSSTLIFLGAFLTVIGVYDDLARFAGAGSIVPITGFSNAVVFPAIEFKSEGYVLGLGAKMFIIAGPVIVYGTVASVIYGIILCIIKLFQ